MTAVPLSRSGLVPALTAPFLDWVSAPRACPGPRENLSKSVAAHGVMHAILDEHETRHRAARRIATAKPNSRRPVRARNASSHARRPAGRRRRGERSRRPAFSAAGEAARVQRPARCPATRSRLSRGAGGLRRLASTLGDRTAADSRRSPAGRRRPFRGCRGACRSARPHIGCFAGLTATATENRPFSARTSASLVELLEATLCICGSPLGSLCHVSDRRSVR